MDIKFKKIKLNIKGNASKRIHINITNRALLIPAHYQLSCNTQLHLCIFSYVCNYSNEVNMFYFAGDYTVLD